MSADQLKQALKEAKIFRLCPPSSAIVQNPSAYEQHKLKCIYCKNRRPDEDQEITFPPLSVPKPEKGDLCLLKPELSTWFEHDYYSAPIVYLIDIDNETGGCMVAQTYHDTRMAAPGDLIIQDENLILGEIFIETWNCYTLKTEWLLPFYKLPAEITKTVIDMKSTNNHPSRAPLPPPMKEHDPREYFRELETKVGYVFASQAATELMFEIESRSEDNKKIVISLTQALKKKVPDIHWSAQPETEFQVFAAARTKESAYSLAASSERPAQFISVNVTEYHNEEIIKFEVHRAKLLMFDQDETGIRIGGQVEHPEKIDPESSIAAFWITKDGEYTDPVSIDFQHDTGFFFIEFSKNTDQEGELTVALISEK